MPIPIRLDDGTYIVPGLGRYDAEGHQLIGLPASSSRAVLRALLDGSYGAQLEAGQQLDKEIEDRASE